MGTDDQDFLRKRYFDQQAHEERLAEPLNERIAARDIDADKERMRAFDYDADNPAIVAKYQHAQQRFEDGAISAKEHNREMEAFVSEQSRKAELEQATAQHGTPSQKLNAHIERTQQPQTSDQRTETREKLEQYIRGHGEGVKDREAQPAFDLDAGGGGGRPPRGPRDRDPEDIRQQFRDAGREVTGLDNNGPPGGPKRPDLER
jgi:hypothetical protein